MSRKTGTLILLAVLVAVMAVVWTRALRRPRRAQAIVLTMHSACSKCDWHGTIELGTRPAPCPSCSEKGVWPAMLCGACGHYQAVDWIRFDGEHTMPYCTKCGSGRLLEIEDE